MPAVVKSSTGQEARTETGRALLDCGPVGLCSLCDSCNCIPEYWLLSISGLIICPDVAVTSDYKICSVGTPPDCPDNAWEISGSIVLAPSPLPTGSFFRDCAWDAHIGSVNISGCNPLITATFPLCVRFGIQQVGSNYFGHLRISPRTSVPNGPCASFEGTPDRCLFRAWSNNWVADTLNPCPTVWSFSNWPGECEPCLGPDAAPYTVTELNCCVGVPSGGSAIVLGHGGEATVSPL